MGPYHATGSSTGLRKHTRTGPRHLQLARLPRHLGPRALATDYRPQREAVYPPTRPPRSVPPADRRRCKVSRILQTLIRMRGELFRRGVAFSFRELTNPRWRWDRRQFHPPGLPCPRTFRRWQTRCGLDIAHDRSVTSI